MKDERTIWKAALATTTGCLPVHRFVTGLSDADAAHVQDCPRCQAELAMWQSFESPAVPPEEGGAVRWITAELHRRQGSSQQQSWGARLVAAVGARRTVTAMAATLGAVLLIYSLREPQIEVPGGSGASIYRSAAIEVVGPVGDLASPPPMLEWRSFTGASAYKVQVMEVDRTVLWRQITTTTSVRLPSTVRAVALPGKTLLWNVEALTTTGETLSTSSIQRFRVKTKPVPSGE